MSLPRPRIIQIIPAAPGWRVVRAIEAGVFTFHVAAWALIERDFDDGEEPERDVVGIDERVLSGDLVAGYEHDEENDLVRYLPPGAEMDDADLEEDSRLVKQMKKHAAECAPLSTGAKA
jgi:hypothetical protein